MCICVEGYGIIFYIILKNKIYNCNKMKSLYPLNHCQNCIPFFMTPIEPKFKLGYVPNLKCILYKGTVWWMFIGLNLSEMWYRKSNLVEDKSEGWFQIDQLRG